MQLLRVSSHLAVSYVAVSHLAVSHVAVSHVAVSHLAVSHVGVSHLAVSQVAGVAGNIGIGVAAKLIFLIYNLFNCVIH